MSTCIALLRLPVAGLSSLSCSQLTEQHSLAPRVHAHFLRAIAPRQHTRKRLPISATIPVVIVYYTRYKLVQLAFAELSPSSRCIPSHSLAESRNRCTSRLQRSLVFFCARAWRLQLTHAFLRMRSRVKITASLPKLLMVACMEVKLGTHVYYIIFMTTTYSNSPRLLHFQTC